MANVSTPIVEHSIKGLYNLKKIAIDKKKASSLREYTQIERDYGELIYNFIMNKMNSILSSNKIIKMPIIFHDNIYYVEYDTESLINTVIQKEVASDIGFFIKYNDDDNEKYSASMEINNGSFKLSKIALSNSNYVRPFISDFIFVKSEELINILNNQLAIHNVRIKKAKLEFCYKLGSRNITPNFPPEILLENIFLKSNVNVFQHFQFVELNNDGNIIMDPTVIYKALSDKQNIDIEAYKLKQEVIENFISMLNL